MARAAVGARAVEEQVVGLGPLEQSLNLKQVMVLGLRLGLEAGEAWGLGWSRTSD